MFYILLITYLLGGLTLVPLLVLALLAFLFYTSIPVHAPKPRERIKVEDVPSSNANALKPSLKSWLTIRRTFEPSPSSYISIVRTLLDARSARPRRAEDAYFAVLKGKILYLYEDELMSECAAAIDVGRCEVRVSPDEGLLEGELFAKRNAILVREKAAPGEGKANEDKEKDVQTQDMTAPWFVFFRAVNEMEDWYLALLAASTSIPPEAFAPFPYTSQKLLIDSLDALPDLIPTRWLNALLGRLFLGVKGTKAVEEWVVGRLMKKLSKVKTPSWLSAVVVRSFDAGDVAPVLSKPMLKELTPEGEASVGVDVSYIAPPDGGIRITLSATATISLPATPSLSMLGFKKDIGKEKDLQKDKPYEVSLVLAVIVRRVEGNMLVKIKRPPSDRLWYAFTTTPRMDIEVTPVVSDRQIRWGMVLSGIEGKLREIIQDSIVLPNMDDVPFFDSSPYPLRGGIFADAFAAPSFDHPSEPHTAATTSEHKEEVTIAQGGGQRLHRSRSAEVLVEGGWDELTSLGPPEPDFDIQRAETIGLGTKVESGIGSVKKRRTWFGGRKSEDSEDGVSEGSGEHRRGRSEEGPGVRVMVTDEDQNENEESQPWDPQKRPTAPPRRSSARSVSDSLPFPRSSSPIDASYTSTAGLSTSAPSASSPTSAPSTSTSSPASPSASSFLSTLKSRGAGMAEKQPALKEAMRKWGVGVNWAAGLRKNDKDINGNTPSLSSLFRDRERERGREREAQEAPDHGDVWSGEDGRRNASPRGSYADLRRKVEQRERERSQEASGSSGSDESGTRPIDIPGVKENTDVSLQRRESNASWSEVSATPSTRRVDSGASTGVKMSPPGAGPAAFLSPSAPKTTTELHTRTPSPTSVRLKSSTPPPQARDRSPASIISSDKAVTSGLAMDNPTPPPRPAAPIRAQPKAATMTIPGIHARHKGEVMGFGSSQPSSPSFSATPVASSSATSTPDIHPTQTAPTGKAVQSVYKLFRSGTTGGVGDAIREAQESEQTLRTTSTPLPAQMSGPPPLPPRAQPIATEFPSSSPTTPRSEPGPSTPPTLFSAASQALKSLAEQDAAARQPPPLPARRRTSTSSAHSRQSSPYAEPAIVPPSASEQDCVPIEKEEGSSAPRTPSFNEEPSWRPPLPPRTNGTKVRNTSSVQ